MKTIWKNILLAFSLLLVVGLTVWRAVKVNEGYELTVTRVPMGEGVRLQGYETRADKAEIYRIDQYYETYPQIAYYKEGNEGVYQYVLVATLGITKVDENAPPLELMEFILHMENSFNQFNLNEMVELNGWTETQRLEPGETLQVKIPYYITEDYFDEKQLENLEKLDYRITWGVYPVRNEMCLDKIENWEKITSEVEKTENPVETDEEIVESGKTGAEAYASLLKEKGLTGRNKYGVGESPTIDGVTYEIKSVREIRDVSEIPDYHEEWMMEGVNALPEYTEEFRRLEKFQYLCEHHYFLVEVDMTNVCEEEKAPQIVSTGLVYEESRWTDVPVLKMASESLYATGGFSEYKGLYGRYVVLQPGETKKVFTLYDMQLDIDPTGEKKLGSNGQRLWTLTEEEADIGTCIPLYFFIDANLGGDMEWGNKGISFVELDWRPEDGTED